MNTKLLKLAKMLLHFASVTTDKAELIYEGDLQVGTEVFVEVEGDMVAAEDGEYIAGDKKIDVKGGKIEEIEVIEEPEPVEEMKKECMEEPVAPAEPEADPEPAEDEKDIRIKELEGLLADRDAMIEELTQKIKELEDKANAPVEEPVKMSKIAMPKYNIKENPALKYFND